METPDHIENLPADRTGKRTEWLRRWLQLMSRSGNRRASARANCGIPVKIWWTDEHGAGSVLGVCVDRSAGGLGVVCPQPLPGRTRLHMQIESDSSVQPVTLRYCQQLGVAYMMGVEFVRTEAPSGQP
ncbi:MAG TPA: PilZ domain-containing protein [Terriglobales bacterium]|nr:PilZ domain-containing protein [Terriglobales bacterium]